MSQKKLGADSSRWRVWIALGICISLLALIWFVFGQTLGFDFVNYDDYDYALKNPHVAAGLTSDGIIWAFTHSYAANWHPLTWLSLMLDAQIHGLAPRGYHLTNVIIHSAATIVLFFVFWRLTSALWRSTLVAAVFAIHPLHVESVAWVAERKDVLSALFFFLTIGAYARYVARPSLSRYTIVLLSFTLGLMCKPMLVTVPFVLLLLDYWPLRRWPNESKNQGRRILRKLLWEKIPLLALAVLSSVMTLHAQKSAIQPVATISLPMRIETAALACLTYVRQMFWPVDLAVFYPLNPSPNLTIISVLALLALAGTSITCWMAQRRRYLLTGWLWYLVMLIPVAGIVQVGAQAHADRYTYLPQIGLYILLVWGAADLLIRWRHHKIFGGVFAVGIVIALALSARSQASSWKDAETLWTAAIERTLSNGIAHLDLGEALQQKGKLPEAIREYEIATHAKIVEVSAHSALGVVLLEAGKPEESIAHLETALKLDPNLGELHYNLGNSFLEVGEYAKAIEHYNRALELDPHDADAQNNLAWLLSTSPSAEARDGRRAVELAESADALTAHKNQVVVATLAAAYAESGRFAEAIKTAERAAELARAEGNFARVDSIRAQLEYYQAGMPFRDTRFSASTR